MNDRRDGEDRRAARRYAITIDIEWEGTVGRQQGTISDVSLLGCFVLCSGDVENGETVKLFFPIVGGMTLWGEVVNHAYEIGFGVRFLELSGPQQAFIQNIMDATG